MDPLIFVIFGASGDLAKRKLIPSFFQLYKQGLLPEHFAILGVSRTEFSDEAFREAAFYGNEHIKGDNTNDRQRTEFAGHIFYQPIQTSNQEDYGKVKERLNELNERFRTGENYLFYLSTPPFLYEKIPAFLSHHGLNDRSKGWKRIIIEKPFGHDEESARQLNDHLCNYFNEDQVFRIDHYLGKETVQNLLVTRFANGIFEPLWNRNFIHHVEVSAAEDIGVETRGGYYDESGALRDMLQNHLLQIMAHIAMEPPITADAKDIRNEKVKLFQAIRPIREEEVEQHVVRGQYMASTIDGQPVPGYREEEGVPNESRTETFVALKFFIDNWRWAGVPFYIRTGKRLPTKVTQVTVAFKSPPHHLFKNVKGIQREVNKLNMRIQPDEGLALQFGMKVPGAGFQVKDVAMDFFYSDLTNAYLPDAYERLIMDCIKGDATLYARAESVEASWRFVDPILRAWRDRPEIPLHGYPAGTWGPEAADQLFENGLMQWENPCDSLTRERHFQVL